MSTIVASHFHKPRFYHGVRDWILLHRLGIRAGARAVVIAGLVFLVLNGVLFALQIGRMPFFTKIEGNNYGFQSKKAVGGALAAEHANRELQVVLGTQTLTLNAEQTGVAIDAGKTIEQVYEAKGLFRWPLVRLFGNLFADYNRVYAISADTLQATLSKYVTEQRTDAVNAQLVIPASTDQQPTIIPEKEGQVLNATVAAEQIAQNVRFGGKFEVKIVPKTVQPEVKTTGLKAVIPKVQAASAGTVTIDSVNAAITLSGAEVRSLLTVVPNGSNDPILSLNNAKLVEMLKQKANVFYKAPVATRVTLLDGQAVSRIDGKEGTTLDVVKTADAVTQAFKAGMSNTKAVLAAAPSPTVYNRTYSNSSAGLYKIIEDFAKSHGGTYKVAVIELGGKGNRSAFYAADDSAGMASVYKMFGAYAALKKIEQGAMSLGTATESGTVDYCIRRMIIYSDNPCGIAILNKIGWAEVDNMSRAAGFTRTKVNSSLGTFGTARDQATMLAKLYHGDLLNDTHREYLLGLMKQQVYRSGIPAGSKGASVANKVGFLGSVNNDMGIVYGPKTTYAVSIMTGSSSFANIKALSEAIYNFYNQ